MLGIPCGVASQTTKPRQPTLTGTLSNSYRTCVQPGLHRVERLWCSSSRIKFRLIHLAPWNPNPPIRHSPRLSLSPLPTQNYSVCLCATVIVSPACALPQPSCALDCYSSSSRVSQPCDYNTATFFLVASLLQRLLSFCFICKGHLLNVSFMVISIPTSDI